MARKRTLSTLDTSIAYEAVGLDLAKEDVALAAFDSDHKEPYLIDRIPYDKLYELLADMAPTLVAMEPCSGAHQIAEQIQELGHEVMMISGRHVQAWVKDHCNGQKTDLRKLFKNPCSQAELNKIVPFGFSLQRQKKWCFFAIKIV